MTVAQARALLNPALDRLGVELNGMRRVLEGAVHAELGPAAITRPSLRAAASASARRHRRPEVHPRGETAARAQAWQPIGDTARWSAATFVAQERATLVEQGQRTVRGCATSYELIDERRAEVLGGTFAGEPA